MHLNFLHRRSAGQAARRSGLVIRGDTGITNPENGIGWLSGPFHALIEPSTVALSWASRDCALGRSPALAALPEDLRQVVRSDAQVLHLHYLVVPDLRRGRGRGRSMAEALHRWGARNGAAGTILCAGDPRGTGPSMGFWEKAGWRIIRVCQKGDLALMWRPVLEAERSAWWADEVVTTTGIPNRHVGEKYEFYIDCVSCHGEDVDKLDQMMEDATEITFETFAAHCNWREHAAGLNYGRDFPLSKDWHVSYYKSRWGGVPCYYFVWSAIEQVFIRPSDQRRLR